MENDSAEFQTFFLKDSKDGSHLMLLFKSKLQYWITNMAAKQKIQMLKQKNWSFNIKGNL